MSDAPLMTTALVLTCEQVSKLLQVPEETVKNLHRTRQLPGVMVGKHLRFKLASVQSFVEALKPIDD